MGNKHFLQREDKKMLWNFQMPVKIIFGPSTLDTIGSVIEGFGFSKGVLVCDPVFVINGLAGKVKNVANGRLVAVYSDITPNPTIVNVDSCADVLRTTNADFAVVLGGGSAIDCAKAACAIAKSNDSIRAYHTENKPLKKVTAIPLIAIPTTAGTGSEVTSVAVLTDSIQKIKAPLGSPFLFPTAAIVDPVLTLSVPKAVTASTGLDVLSHALEGFWSVNHQPICDALATRAAKLVFQYLMVVYDNPNDLVSREAMCEASLLAGISFSHPKTSGPHACSFPLTNIYGLPHGEACAFTLDAFVRINAAAENGRLHSFANECGYKDAFDMANAICTLKKYFGMPSKLKDAGVDEQQIKELAQESMHPNMLNNPVKMDVDAVEKVYRTIG
jgi:alcohol dehydrogenase